MVCPSYSTAFALDRKGAIVKEFSGEGDHFGNFVKAVRSRKKEDLNADILEGHISSALCHLANISYRLGKTRTVGQDARGMGLGEAGPPGDGPQTESRYLHGRPPSADRSEEREN